MPNEMCVLDFNYSAFYASSEYANQMYYAY